MICCDDVFDGNTAEALIYLLGDWQEINNNFVSIKFHCPSLSNVRICCISVFHKILEQLCLIFFDKTINLNAIKINTKD